jgi:hypothetical protein
LWFSGKLLVGISYNVSFPHLPYPVVSITHHITEYGLERRFFWLH